MRRTIFSYGYVHEKTIINNGMFMRRPLLTMVFHEKIIINNGMFMRRSFLTMVCS
jgi:hypothetical protein